MNTKKLTKIAIIIALGIILPQAASHLVGIPGTYLLPMHFCVTLAGLLCGGLMSVIGACVIITASFFITGMPAFPLFIPLLAELVMVGFASGYIYADRNIFMRIFATYTTGRMIFLIVAVMFVARELAYIMVLQGLGAIVLQLAILPLVCKMDKTGGGKKHEEQFRVKAKKKITSGFSMVVVRGHKAIYESQEFGVKPIFNLGYELSRTIVFDKIVGRAAALLFIYYRVAEVYADVISKPAMKLLDENKIPYSYRKKVEVVLNKDHSAPCPMEKLLENETNPKEAFKKLTDFVKK